METIEIELNEAEADILLAAMSLLFNNTENEEVKDILADITDDVYSKLPRPVLQH
jgi:hypothetical protein